jgi:glutamate-1-semialdehyde 2,1-aminomutase
MLTPFFTGVPVDDYKTAKLADVKRFADWFQWMKREGILLPPSQFEASFISTAHDEEALAFLAARLERSFAQLNAR